MGDQGDQEHITAIPYPHLAAVGNLRLAPGDLEPLGDHRHRLRLDKMRTAQVDLVRKSCRYIDTARSDGREYEHHGDVQGSREDEPSAGDHVHAFDTPNALDGHREQMVSAVSQVLRGLS